MAIYNEQIMDVDLETGTTSRSFLNHVIGEGDSNGNKFGARLKKNGETVSLSGASCMGYFIRPDGITLIINGETSGNVASVTLPEAAYAAEGNFTLAIKVSGTGFADTVRIIDGTVVNTTTGTISDPASEIPSLEDLTAIIGAAEAAAAGIDRIQIGAVQITNTRYRINITVEE